MSTAVLVHGLWYGPVSMALVALRMDRQGVDCHRFSYPTLRGTLEDHARALGKFAGRLGQPELHFVGHSLGGLVILRMLADEADLPPGRVVLLGTPVQGSSVSRRIGRHRPLRPFLGDSRYSLEAGFARCPGDRQVGVIAGTAGVGIGRALGGLEEPHDGTVSVAETRLEGVCDRVDLRVSHTGLVLSAEVVSATLRFLATGRFSQ